MTWDEKTYGEHDEEGLDVRVDERVGSVGVCLQRRHLLVKLLFVEPAGDDARRKELLDERVVRLDSLHLDALLLAHFLHLLWLRSLVHTDSHFLHRVQDAVVVLLLRVLHRHGNAVTSGHVPLPLLPVDA